MIFLFICTVPLLKLLFSHGYFVDTFSALPLPDKTLYYFKLPLLVFKKPPSPIKEKGEKGA
jgi:hypothetical protein